MIREGKNYCIANLSKATDSINAASVMRELASDSKRLLDLVSEIRQGCARREGVAHERETLKRAKPAQAAGNRCGIQGAGAKT